MTRTQLRCDAVTPGDLATDPVSLLAEALEPQLGRLIKAARRVMPGIDGATFASLLITYGVEIGAETGSASRTDMADYLRAVADALDTGEPVFPSLKDVMASTKEPPF